MKDKKDEIASHKDAVYRDAKAVLEYYDEHRCDYGIDPLLDRLRNTIKRYEADMYVTGE